jgi:hypothetical protein
LLRDREAVQSWALPDAEGIGTNQPPGYPAAISRQRNLPPNQPPTPLTKPLFFKICFPFIIKIAKVERLMGMPLHKKRATAKWLSKNLTCKLN